MVSIDGKRRFDGRLGLGLLLILAGLLALLQNLGWIAGVWSWLWAGVLALTGIGFLARYFSERAAWWPLLPGLICLDLAVLIGLGAAAPEWAGRWGGVVFLAGLAAPFWAIALGHRENWWGLIPAGVLTTLSAVAGVGHAASGPATGGLFFAGLGLTFAIVWLAPGSAGQRRWALWPAGILTGLGLLVATPLASLANLVFPVALILAGGFLLYRAFRPPPA